jgi:4-aminobutyrate aminotransferase
MINIEKPEIKTELPGPKARQILERHRKYISPSYPKAYDLVAERAKGVWVWDVDGNKFLDMVAGVAVNSTGHSHPKVVKAIKEQVEKLIHISTDFYHELEVKLAEKLSSIFPSKGNNMVFFTNSGTESNEGAIKLAKFNTKEDIHFIV